MNEYSPKTWLALEIFAVIFVLIKSSSFIACSDKSSKFNTFACTLVVSEGVLACLQWYKLFIDELKAIYFASFYFRVFNSISEIRENKNLAKISTYTVYFVMDIKASNIP